MGYPKKPTSRHRLSRRWDNAASTGGRGFFAIAVALDQPAAKGDGRDVSGDRASVAPRVPRTRDALSRHRTPVRKRIGVLVPWPIRSARRLGGRRPTGAPTGHALDRRRTTGPRPCAGRSGSGASANPVPIIIKSCSCLAEIAYSALAWTGFGATSRSAVEWIKNGPTLLVCAMARTQPRLRMSDDNPNFEILQGDEK
jgi:hypothetical protein